MEVLLFFKSLESLHTLLPWARGSIHCHCCPHLPPNTKLGNKLLLLGEAKLLLPSLVSLLYLPRVSLFQVIIANFMNNILVIFSNNSAAYRSKSSYLKVVIKMISSDVGYLLGAGKPFYALALLGLILPQVYFQVNPFIFLKKHEIYKPCPVGIECFGFKAQV